MSDVIKNVSQPDILPAPMPIDKPNLASSSTDHEAAKTRNVTQSVLQSNALDETLKKRNELLVTLLKEKFVETNRSEAGDKIKIEYQHASQQDTAHVGGLGGSRDLCEMDAVAEFMKDSQDLVHAALYGYVDKITSNAVLGFRHRAGHIQVILADLTSAPPSKVREKRLYFDEILPFTKPPGDDFLTMRWEIINSLRPSSQDERLADSNGSVLDAVRSRRKAIKSKKVEAISATSASPIGPQISKKRKRRYQSGKSRKKPRKNGPIKKSYDVDRHLGFLNIPPVPQQQVQIIPQPATNELKFTLSLPVGITVGEVKITGIREQNKT